MDQTSSSDSTASVHVIVRPDVRPKSYSLTPATHLDKNGDIKPAFNGHEIPFQSYLDSDESEPRQHDYRPRSAPQSPLLRRALHREQDSAHARIRDVIFKVKGNPRRRVSDGNCLRSAGCDGMESPEEFSDATGPLLCNKSRKEIKVVLPSKHEPKSSNEPSNETLLRNLREYEEYVQLSKKLVTEQHADSTTPVEDRNPVTIKKREMLLAIGLLICISIALGLLLVMMLNKIEKFLEEVPETSKSQPQCIDKVECLRHAYEMLDMMDISTNPCADLYQYACGGWIKSRDIPAHSSSWSVSSAIQETADSRLRAILENENNQKEKVDSPFWKARTMYTKCKDDDNREASFQYLQTQVPELEQWLSAYSNENTWDFDGLLNRLYWEWNIVLFFTVWVAPDDKLPHEMIIQFDQGGLNLHFKDIYGEENNQTMAYKEYIRKTLIGLGSSSQNALHTSENICEFEKALAKIHYEIQFEQQESAFYHKMNVAELQNLSPEINWSAFLWAGFPSYFRLNMAILITVPDYFQKLSVLIHNSSNVILRDYMLWSLINKYAIDLPGVVSKLTAEFVSDQTLPQPRWQHCAAVVSEWFSDAVSAAYAKEYLPPAHRNQVVQVGKEMSAKLMERLKTNKWLSNHTKDEAIKRISSMKMVIGYPEFLLSKEHLEGTYRDFAVAQNDSYLEILASGRRNDVSIMRWQLRNNAHFQRLHVGIHKPEAFFDPILQTLYIQAGMLQSPHYIPNLPSSFTFGAIGSIIAHEMLHNFDARGGFDDGWSEDSFEAYSNDSDCLVSHYNGYKFEDIHLNGSRTLVENRADVQGLRLAFEAYQSHEKQQGKGLALPGLGLSNQQTFFLAFAQNFCSKHTPSDMRRILNRSRHSPDEFRVKGTLRNMPEFAKAFNCPRMAHNEAKCSFVGI